MRVAVVGSGVSGLGATWLLNEYSSHEVHLYEADSRPGGHAHTVPFVAPKVPSSKSIDVDTGFIVLNPSTYPNFLRFLKLNDIAILPTEMTFSMSRDKGLFEWAGNNLRTAFCQPSRLLDPKMWRLIYDVLRFNACARRLIADSPAVESVSIGEYLHQNCYSTTFRDNYLIPMTAAVWSTPPDKCNLEFPARTLIQFMNNHHLLQLTGKPAWLTIKGGSRVYVNKILSALSQDRLHLSSPVKSVKTTRQNTDSPWVVQIETANDHTVTYDHVIIACHSDTALSLLRAGGGLTVDEERILGRFQWNKNVAVLHSDIELMPKRRLAWSCWNYLTYSAIDSHGNHKANVNHVALTCNSVLIAQESVMTFWVTDWMNELQHISEEKHGSVLVTLNPPFEPRQGTVVGRWAYEHPVLNAEAVLSQKEMALIQNVRGISYAGAYLRYGFHEDGFTSGVRAVSEHLEVPTPFHIQDADVGPGILWPGYIFDAFEWSGISVLIGLLMFFWLRVTRTILGICIDFSHLDE